MHNRFIFPILLAFSFSLLAFRTIAAEPPVDLSAFPPEFFPGLKHQSPERIYLKGLMALYPGRILDHAPDADAITTPREPLVESLPRGITYVRVYDLPGAKAALLEHINTPILLIDLRYVAGSVNEALSFAIPFKEMVNLSLTENGKPVDKGAFDYPEKTKRTVSQPAIVLINQKTSGPIEAALSALQSAGDIMTVGTRTAGATGQYAPLPNAEGYWVIDGEVRAGNGPSLLGVGLEPEVPVNVTADEDFTGYQLLENGYSAEAILKTRLPALDPHGSENNKDAEQSVDPILQRAVDIVIALQVLGKLPME